MNARERYLEALAKHPPGSPRVAPVKPAEEKHVQVAKDVLRRGKTIYKSLVDAGYAPKQAKKGMDVVKRTRALRIAFQQETAKIEKELAETPLRPRGWDVREQLILARLEKNIRAGKDTAVMSAKLLGSHKKLNLWQPENQTGIIILNSPAEGTDFRVPDSKMLPSSDE
jgi:hypothetical protein